MRILTGITLSVILFAQPGTVQALRRYYCAGRVQFRPCNFPYIGSPEGTVAGAPQQLRRFTARSDGPAGRPQPALPPTSGEGRLFGRVLSSRFDGLGNGLGRWSGRIEGYGALELSLEIVNERGMIATREMGTVYLAGKATSFDFRSSIPKEPRWSWRVAVRTRPIPSETSTPDDQPGRELAASDGGNSGESESPSHSQYSALRDSVIK